jgi:hypothetical protein
MWCWHAYRAWLSRLHTLPSLHEVAFDGGIGVRAVLGGGSVCEPRPYAVVSSLDCSQPRGLDGAASYCVEETNEGFQNGEVIEAGMVRLGWWFGGLGSGSSIAKAAEHGESSGQVTMLN